MLHKLKELYLDYLLWAFLCLNQGDYGVFGLGYVIILKLGLFPTKLEFIRYPYSISTNNLKGGYEIVA